MPEDVTPVSPAYIIETSRKVELRKDVELTMQHTASLQTTEDKQDMIMMKVTDKTPSVRKFEEMKGAKIEVARGYVKMKVKSIISSIFKVGRRNKSKAKGKDTVY